MSGKSLCAALFATFVLGALASVASARNFSISNQGVRSTFREVVFNMPFGDTNCEVTLEGSMHNRTIAKVVGSLVGYITRAIKSICRTGALTILTETLPWHVRYAGFEGTLPRPLSINVDVIGWSQRFREPFGITCLWRSSPSEPARVRFNLEPAGVVTGATIGGVIRSGPECFEEVVQLSSSTGTVTLLATTTRISIRLI